MENNSQIIDMIEKYCMMKKGAYETRPFGEYPICYRVMGKIFAQINPQEDFYKATLKCNPDNAYMYRDMYKDVVVRGYHCPPVQQPYWNTIDLYKFDEETMLFQMIDEAYEEVVTHLTRKNKERLMDISEVDFVYNEDSKAITVYEDSVRIGYGCFKMADEETCIVDDIFVENEYRRKGIGQEILRRLEARARINGYSYSKVYISNLTDAAVHMLGRQGYKNPNERKAKTSDDYMMFEENKSYDEYFVRKL